MTYERASTLCTQNRWRERSRRAPARAGTRAAVPWYIHRMTPTTPDPLSEAARVNLTVARQMRATAWALADAALRTFRPELDEDAIQAEIRAQFRRASE